MILLINPLSEIPKVIVKWVDKNPPESGNSKTNVIRRSTKLSVKPQLSSTCKEKYKDLHALPRDKW